MSIRTVMTAMVVLAWFSWAGGGTVSADEGRLVNLKALMIQAQNDSAPMDRRLEKVEYKLRRVFGFQFYLYVGEGSIMLPPGGQGFIDLPDGHRLAVSIGRKGGNAEIRWSKEQEPLLSTSVALAKDSPVVLGGIPSNGGKLILVLTAENIDPRAVMNGR